MKYLLVVLVVLLSFGFFNVRAQSDCLKGFKANRVFTNEVEFKEWLAESRNDTVAILECLKTSALDSIVVDDFTGCVWTLKGLSAAACSPSDSSRTAASRTLGWGAFASATVGHPRAQ
jgi:hypothetical protein